MCAGCNSGQMSHTQGVYNEGSLLDARPFQSTGKNAAMTQSLSNSEAGVTSRNEFYTLTKSSYKGNPKNSGNGALG